MATESITPKAPRLNQLSHPIFPFLSDPLGMDNILSPAYLKSKDLKSLGTDKSLMYIVKEFNKLSSEGILFQIFGEQKRVKFQLALLIGDNMGLNMYMELNTHSSNCFCRFCRLLREETRTQNREIVSALRTKENYDEDVLKKDPKATGVLQETPLNNIKNWHITENRHADSMHDWFEGVLHYSMCNIISNFISKKYLTLALLNNRIETFSYGSIEIGNKPTKITDAHIK